MTSLYEISAKDAEISAERTRLNDVERRISGQQSEIARTNDLLAQSLQRLARVYVPGFTQTAVNSVPDEFRRHVAELYEQKQTRIEQLEGLLVASETRTTDLQRREIEAATELARATEQRDKLEDTYRETLEKNPGYQAARAERAELRLAHEVETKELARRKERKDLFQKEYLADPFFSYFLRRDVETKVENPTFAQRFDRRLARRVYKFSERKCRYDMFDAEVWECDQQLSEITEDLAHAEKPVKEIEKKIASELGLTAAQEQVTKLSAGYTTAAETLAQATQEHARYRDERRSLDEERGGYYQKAVGGVVSSLTGRSIDDLVELARATPSTEDDGIVDVIEDQRTQIVSYNSAVSGLRGEERSIESIISQLQSTRNALQSAYDAEQREIARRRREEEERQAAARRERERAAAAVAADAARRSREASYTRSRSTSSISIGGGSTHRGGSMGGGATRRGGSF